MCVIFYNAYIDPAFLKVRKPRNEYSLANREAGARGRGGYLINPEGYDLSLIRVTMFYLLILESNDT